MSSVSSFPWNGRFDAETASTAEELASTSLSPELRKCIGGIKIVLGTPEESESDFMGVDDVGKLGLFKSAAPGSFGMLATCLGLNPPGKPILD